MEGYNSFGYLRETENTVYISREKGKDTPVSFTKILIAIEAYQKQNDLYELGPSALRNSGLTHVTRPIWSMLHILEKTDYQKTIDYFPMNLSDKEITQIKEKYRFQIDRLDKMMLNMYAVSNIRYWYDNLSNIPLSENHHRDFMLIEAVTTSIVISYGRLFGETNGTITLDKKHIPKNLIPVHQQIIDLRNDRYAHHGKHSSVEKNISIKNLDSAFIVLPNINIGFWIGAPKHWAPLFKWLDEYLYNTTQKILTFLTCETGIEWKMTHGEAPRG